MLFTPSAVSKQDQLHTLTRAASVIGTDASGSNRRFIFGAQSDSSDSQSRALSEDESVGANTSPPTSPVHVKLRTDVVSAHTVVHQGILARLTSWGQWKERYFVMDRVGIFWYRSQQAMEVAREQLLGGQALSVFALRQLGLKVVWVVSLRLFRDPGGAKFNQLSLNSPNKIMKLRAPSPQAMEAWITAFETLRESLASEFKAAPSVQRNLIREHSLVRDHSNHSAHSRHVRSQSSSQFVGQSMFVAGNSAIIRSRSTSAASPKQHARRPTFGATFVIGGDMASLEAPSVQSPPNNSIQRESVAQESVSGDKYLLESRPDSSVSVNYMPLEADP